MTLSAVRLLKTHFQKHRMRIPSALTLILLTNFVETQADFLPLNQLHLQDHLLASGQINESEFNDIITEVIDSYQPLAQLNGAQLSSYNDWQDSTVNAAASRQGNRWLLNFSGGLARRPEVTPDAFTIVVCHEVGHHFAGFPFKGGIQGTLTGGWSSVEGQADYFATHGCLQRLWQNQNNRVKDVPAEIKQQCQKTWPNLQQQELCERSTLASLAVSKLIAFLKNQAQPNYNTPDTDKVRVTLATHANAQCRLDSLLAGALCSKAFSDDGKIPGKRFLGIGQNSKEAEAEANLVSCPSLKEETNQRSLDTAVEDFTSRQNGRPKCWFAPQF